MFPPDRRWSPNIAWDCPAGSVLERLIACIATKPCGFTVFGSAPLQLGVEKTFTSGDVDIFATIDLSEAIKKAGLEKGVGPMYVEQSDESVFIASHSWRDRAFVVESDGVFVTLPHPIDILVAKIRRLETKDMDAYRLVFSKTGHPLESELKTALQRVVDIYRPSFDEEGTLGDPAANTRTVWRELYNREIDVRAEIVAPALARRSKSYGQNLPTRKNSLDEIGRTKPSDLDSTK